MKRFETVNRSARPGRRTMGACAIALAMAGAIVAGPQDDDVSSEIQAMRNIQEEWREVRTQISKEKAAIAERKLTRNDRINLAKSQIEATRALIEERRTKAASNREKLDEIKVENDKLEAAQSSLEDKIEAFEAEVSALVKRLPAPLVDDVRQYTQQFPKPGVESKASLSQRYTLAVAVLNVIDKYNTEVHLANEQRGGAEVTTLYLGISQGFYVNKLGTVAGRGTPTDEGFEWTPINESAPLVQQAVRIFNGDEAAAYKQLPVILDGINASADGE